MKTLNQSLKLICSNKLECLTVANIFDPTLIFETMGGNLHKCRSTQYDTFSFGQKSVGQMSRLKVKRSHP